MPRRSPAWDLPFLFYKLRTGFRLGGLSWLCDRVTREWQMPTTAPGRKIYRALRTAKVWVTGRQAAASPSKPDDTGEVLYAFYDLAVAPITFDFLWFLAGADLVRRRLGKSTIHVVIVPGPREGLRREQPDYEKVIGSDARRARISNILLPACALLPSVSGVTVEHSRQRAKGLVAGIAGSVFPEGYEPALPIYPGPHLCLEAARSETAPIGVLRALPTDLDAVRRWVTAHGRGGRPITITLRSYGYMPARNSNTAAWLAFAHRLDRTHYTPIFVPDTDQTLDGLPAELADFPVYSEAAWNLGLRMALYEHAWLNLGVNNGPMGLCWLNDRTHYLTFKMLTESVPQASSRYVASLGFELGQSLPFATSAQKWVWEDDELSVIEREFAAMIDRLSVSTTMAASPPKASA